MKANISQQEIQQTAVRLGIPLDAEWAEKGGWYLNGIAVPTALVPQISAFRQDEKRIAVTGHRDIDKRTVDAAKWWIDKIAVKYSNATIITGGALGTDLLVATLAIKAGLQSKVYLPFEFETHTSRWNAASKGQLKWVLDRSEVVVVGGSEYSVRLYFRRNERMVDNANLVLAFWDGREEGGTVGCIKYAQHKDKMVFDAFSRGELDPLPGENFYDKYEVLSDNANNTIDYFDDATLFSSIFKIDMERHGDGTDGTEAKERELAQVSQFKLRCYFQSADYQVHHGIVFERHEDISYRDSNSIACRVWMATKCSGEDAQKVGKYLEIVDKERRMEDKWIKWLKKDFDRTVAYLETLYNELVNCEPDVELEAVLEWIGASQQEGLSPQITIDKPELDELDIDGVYVKPTQVQSWNDDPSEDGWDELDEDGVVADATYGWHRLDDPKEVQTPKIETMLSKGALTIYQRVETLEGKALVSYGKVLYRTWKEWKDGKRKGMTQTDWNYLWGTYKESREEMTIEIRTSQIPYEGNDGIDITVKSGKGIGREFAPEWEWVTRLKSGQMTWTEYEMKYLTKLRTLWQEKRWVFQKLLERRKVTLVCYCRDDTQCHRRLLREILVNIAENQGIEVTDEGEVT